MEFLQIHAGGQRKKVLLIKAEFGIPATTPEEKDGIKGQCYEKVSHYVPLFSGYWMVRRRINWYQ